MKLPLKTPGNTFYEQSFNGVIDSLKSLRPMRGNGTMTRHTPFGTSRRAGAQIQQAPVTVLNMFQTVECFGDYFTAYLVLNGTPGAILFYIAKPYNLRASLTEETFDGNLVTYDYSIDDGTGNYRTATLGDTVETQVMIPRYKPSTVDTNQDIIFAESSVGTGVSEVDNQVGKWLEIKPARMWAKQYSS